MVRIGKRIKIISDNENYSEYIGMILKIASASNSGYLYDNSMYPDMLCELETLDGENVPFCLYEYEFIVL